LYTITGTSRLTQFQVTQHQTCEILKSKNPEITAFLNREIRQSGGIILVAGRPGAGYAAADHVPMR